MQLNQLACLTTILSSTLAHAQVADADYLVEHNFSYQPTGDVVEVFGADFRHAWIKTRGVLGNAWGVAALNQSPNFDPFGTESFATGAGGLPVAFNSGIGSPVECVYNIFPIPPAGINDFACIILPHGQSNAAACTEYVVHPYNTVPPFNIQGSVASSGGVHAFNAECYAYSSAAISVRGGIDMGSGNIQWNPVINEIVGGGIGALGLTADPIHFIANNLDDGTQIQSTLLDYTLSSEGHGTVQWDNGVFHTDRTEFEFTLTIPSTHVDPASAGTMHLKVEQGIVTIADDTGFFDNLLPVPGTNTPLTFPLPNDFNLPYDLNLDPIFNWDVTADLSGAGGTYTSSFCPADLNGDGELDFLDISLFLKLYTAGDLQADLNGDKELDFLDISDFLSSYTSGCIEE